MSSVIGGASLWVMAGRKPEEYKGVAQFFKYLASTENQAWWAGVTGYLPISNAAVKAMEAAGASAIVLEVVPAELAARVTVGSRVVVPVGSRRALGFVIGEADAVAGMKLRAVQSAPDDAPVSARSRLRAKSAVLSGERCAEVTSIS